MLELALRNPHVATLPAAMRASQWIRNLHLFIGLFISPFVLVFAISVFFLVHAWLPQASVNPAGVRLVSDLPLPANLETLSGRERIRRAQRRVLRRRRFMASRRDPAPGQGESARDPVHDSRTSHDGYARLGPARSSIQEQSTGLASALVLLHKSPGPHLTRIRMNWAYMRVGSGWRMRRSTCFCLSP